MTAIGIDLKEVRIVSDDEDDIVAAVNALRARYTYVFTTGGIGPTHDDITADSIAKAFGVPCDYDEKAYALLERAAMPRASIEFTEARKRMARMPRGADPYRQSRLASRRASASATSMSWPACRRSSRPCSTMSCRR